MKINIILVSISVEKILMITIMYISVTTHKKTYY
jgi:hypothetical protein